ncbi:MAG: helix-turn-helix domain-containing protein [Patescibacteria group bacterium]|nr:helix-turn-helix domain-containing protein [Patescibacteria group bacterium]
MDKIKTVKKKKIDNPVWLTVSQAAQLGGINTKTIRRAIQSKIITYKIIGNRYFIELASLIIYLHSSIKLKNKFEQFGIGQYVEKWNLRS